MFRLQNGTGIAEPREVRCHRLDRGGPPPTLRATRDDDGRQDWADPCGTGVRVDGSPLDDEQVVAMTTLRDLRRVRAPRISGPP